MKNKKLYRLLNLALRYQPKILEVPAEELGWTFVGKLVNAINNRTSLIVSSREIVDLVKEDKNKMFVLNEYGTRIKANLDV